MLMGAKLGLEGNELGKDWIQRNHPKIEWVKRVALAWYWDEKRTGRVHCSGSFRGHLAIILFLLRLFGNLCTILMWYLGDTNVLLR